MVVLEADENICRWWAEEQSRLIALFTQKEQLIIEVTAHFDVVAEAVQPVHYLAKAEGVQRFGRFGGVHCFEDLKGKMMRKYCEEDL